MLRPTLIVVISCWLAVGVSSADSSGALPMTPATAASIQLTGTYDSNYGPVHLTQRGARIAGTYECCGGGRVTGTLRDGVIDYEWHESGVSGRGRWHVRRGGAELVGTWGTGTSATSGGDWSLSRQQTIAR